MATAGKSSSRIGRMCVSGTQRPAPAPIRLVSQVVGRTRPGTRRVRLSGPATISNCVIALLRDGSATGCQRAAPPVAASFTQIAYHGQDEVLSPGSEGRRGQALGHDARAVGR